MRAGLDSRLEAKGRKGERLSWPAFWSGAEPVARTYTHHAGLSPTPLYFFHHCWGSFALHSSPLATSAAVHTVRG